MVDLMDPFVEILRVQDSVANVETEIEIKAEQHQISHHDRKTLHLA